MGESLSLAALLIDGGFADTVAAMTSSHFCTAERQYRMPVPMEASAPHSAVDCHRRRLHHSAQQRIRSLYHPCHLRKSGGQRDHGRQQYGAAMAPAAYDTLSAFFRDTGTRRMTMI